LEDRSGIDRGNGDGISAAISDAPEIDGLVMFDNRSFTKSD
jgi:hypothetical protein